MFDALRRFFSRDEKAARRHGTDVLKDIAGRTSCSVQDVWSRLRLPIGTTYAVVASLERRGLVRVSKEQGASRERIVAITNRGREEAKR